MTAPPLRGVVDGAGAPPSAAQSAAMGRRASAATRGERPWAVTTRDWARQVRCPRCGADVGELCRRDRGGPRQTQHWQRHSAAIAAGAPVVKRFDTGPVDAAPVGTSG